MTETELPTTDNSLHRYTREPFVRKAAGLLLDPLPDELLDTPGAHAWFETVRANTSAGLYTYQLPLSQAVGAHTAVMDEQVLMFSSYSYLGLNGHPRISAAAHAAIERFATTSGGARLLTGTLAVHRDLEVELARFLGTEAAAAFSSGYDANVAVIPALFGPGDHVLLDQFAHRSIADGAALSGATVLRFRHNDHGHLARRLSTLRSQGAKRILVAIDGVYSMHGDMAPLPEIVEITKRFGAFLLVDESHSIGVMGGTGRGTCEATGVSPADVDLITGSLAKAIPSQGGFVAGSASLQVYLQHGSGPAVFSGALAPASTAAILESLRVIDDEPQLLARLWENTRHLRDTLAAVGLSAPGDSPIVPLVLGDRMRTWRWSKWLLDCGIVTTAVLYPAVPPNMGMLRLCATSAHSPEDYERLAEGLRYCSAND